METPNPNKKVYFSGDTAEIISNILKKYSLEETDEELGKKLLSEDEKQEPFVIRGGVVLKTAISLFNKEITEKDASTFLQKQLNTSQTIAGGMVNEIKTNLLSIATTEKPVKAAPETVAKPATEMKPLPSFAKAAEPIEENPVMPEEKPRSKPELPTKKQEKIKKPAIPPEEIKKSAPQSKQPKGPDSYREPIQ